MLHAHLDLITTADPLALRGCIDYIEHQVRPVVESQPGSLGLSLLASPEHGVAVCESLWASRNELGASEQAAASLRGEMARQARGSVTAEQYQIPVFEQEAPLRGGEGLMGHPGCAQGGMVRIVPRMCRLMWRGGCGRLSSGMLKRAFNLFWAMRRGMTDDEHEGGRRIAGLLALPARHSGRAKRWFLGEEAVVIFHPIRSGGGSPGSAAFPRAS